MIQPAKFVALFVLSLAGCAESARCVETSRTAVADASTALLIGGTYQDVLDTLVGDRSGTITWLANEGLVRGFPDPGDGPITVAIEEPTFAWNVDLDKEGGRRNERLTCPDSLEVELEIELRTDDGVLDATIAAPVILRTPDAATILLDVTDEDLGMLDWSPVEDGATLLLSLSYGVNGSEGALRLRSASADDSEGVGNSVELATWVVE